MLGKASSPSMCMDVAYRAQYLQPIETTLVDKKEEFAFDKAVVVLNEQ